MADEAGRVPGGGSGVPPGKTGWRGTPAGEYLAEFLGTFVLVGFGTAVVAMYVAALPLSGRGEGITSDADWLLICWGWGMAVVFGVYVAGGVTGAHINPAVTVAFASFGRFPWRKVPGYIVAQVLGALAGAALVYMTYRDAIQAFEAANGIERDGGDGTVSIFVTPPAPYFDDYWGPFITEVIGTAFLLLIIFAVVDRMNLPPKANLAPLIIGLGVFAIGMSWGANSGYAINPARDFGPRVLTWLMGWGDAAFPGAQNNLGAYWWVPVVGPLIGAVIGAAIYKFVIEDILHARRKPEDLDVISRGETVEDES
ncbi:MIP/aquaporin family protein [Miltoncostaea marina]|uniref:MIP/aquaporin family protein n=1 Tax=Miltoncostaea marina TaxID=2843215 RepID=UPI001C3D8A03|nr:MIP family channel protein [Miltoncostaea marina]